MQRLEWRVPRMEAACVHDLKYAGAANVMRGEEVVKVVEAWRCRRCGATRVGLRGPGTTASTDGLLELLGPGDSRWIVVVGRGVGAIPPSVSAIAAKPGDPVRLDPPHLGEEELVVSSDYRLRRRDGGEPTNVRGYPLEEVLTGWVEVSEWPPRVITLRRQSG